MYGKVFESMYDGTLRGHWQAIVTMQQLVVLATPDGIVDMTPEAIAGRTSIPLEIIQAGLAHLAKADEYTRTPGEEGRRIVLLDDHRPWGWRLVNHGKYRGLRDLEQKREADRIRMAEKRKENSGVATASRGVAKVAHSDTDTDTGKEALSGGAPDGDRQAKRRREAKATAERVLTYLNERAGTKYRPTDAHLRLMMGRILHDQANEAEMRAVVDAKVKDWADDPEHRRWLSPDTLFNATKYAKYVGQLQIGAAAAGAKQGLIFIHLQAADSNSKRTLVTSPTMAEKVDPWDVIAGVAKNPGYRRSLEQHKGYVVLELERGGKSETLAKYSPREIAEGLQRRAA